MRSLLLFILLFVAFQLTGQSKAEEIDKMMNYASANGYFNGSIAVLDKGKTVYCNSFGYANFHTKKKNDNNTIYELASVTKQFTAMAIMILKEKGKLSYNDSLRKYFPELPYSGVTIRQMLNHTSGMPDYIREIGFLYWNPEKIYSNEDAIQELAKYKLPFHFKPGEKFEYCNTGYMLLASIVEKASGLSFEKFLRINIFKPLGMNYSGLFTRYANMNVKDGNSMNIGHGFVYDLQTNQFELPENVPQLRVVRSFGGLYGDGLIGSSISDMIKWELALATEKLVKNTTLEEAFTSGKTNSGEAIGYGFGWFLQMDKENEFIAQHTGGWSGVRNAVIRWVDKDRILVVLRNSDIDFTGIQDAVKNILNGNPWVMPKPSMAQTLAIAAGSDNPELLIAKYNQLKPDKAVVSEEQINQLGYMLLESKKIKCAVEVLKINSESFPQSWNAFDSLGEAYLKAGNTQLAKASYRRSLELNPKNENAKRILSDMEGN